MHQGLFSFFARQQPAQPPPSVANLAVHPLPQRWQARCGTPLTLRPVRHGDAGLLGQLLDEGLSQQSRYSRFHGALGRLSPARLAWLAEVDFKIHVAFVVTLVDQGQEQAVAEGRWFRTAGSSRAELALAVADRWQQQGLGGRLLRALVHAAQAAGLDELAADVMAGNRAMLALATGHQFQSTEHPDDQGLVRAAVALSASPRNRWASLPWLH